MRTDIATKERARAGHQYAQGRNQTGQGGILTGPPPSLESEITRLAQSVDQALMRLNGKTENLMARLDHVLMPPSPQQTSSTLGRDAHTVVGRTLAAYIDMLDIIEGRIDAMNDRLAL